MAVQPKILTIPFARDATPDLVNEIPDDPNPLVPQSASWEQGFPYVTMIPLVAGGIPPQGQDFNGIMKAITEHTVFQGAGGFYKFDADVVAAGGYGLGAVLEADDGLSLWVSLVDNNVEDFNTGTPTQWRKISQGVPQTVNGSTTNASDADGHTHAVSLASETVAGVMEIATATEAQSFTVGKAIDGAGLGAVVNFTWQDRTATRAWGATYTNGNKIRRIMVGEHTVGAPNNRIILNLNIDGTLIGGMNGTVSAATSDALGNTVNLYCEIPPNKDYSITRTVTGATNPNSFYWFEAE